MHTIPREYAEEKGEQAGEEGDEERLDLEEREVAKDEGTSGKAHVEFANVSLHQEVRSAPRSRETRTNRGGEARCEVHFEVAFEVEEDRNQDEELLYPNKDSPFLRYTSLIRSWQTKKRRETHL